MKISTLAFLILAFLMSVAQVYAQMDSIITIPDATLDKDSDIVYTVVEIPAEFPGGQTALQKYLASNIVYPKEAVKNNLKGRVLVYLEIDKLGNVINIKIQKSSTFEILDLEALRVVKAMPRWRPGKMNNKAVIVRLLIPINFVIPEPVINPTK